MKFDDLMRLALKHFPGAEVCEDNYGQLIIYTDTMLDGDEVVQFEPTDDGVTDGPLEDGVTSTD